MKIIISTIIVILFSCNTIKKSSSVQSFPSGDYEIVEFKDKAYKPQENYTLNINAEEQRIGGKFDCNTFSCSYEKDGQKIDFGYAMATKMYCEGEMYNENAFFGKLQKLKSYEFDGELLTFYDEEGTMILKLKKQKS